MKTLLVVVNIGSMGVSILMILFSIIYCVIDFLKVIQIGTFMENLCLLSMNPVNLVIHLLL